MKAYKDEKGRPRLFRPNLNIRRLRRSSLRAGLPVFFLLIFFYYICFYKGFQRERIFEMLKRVCQG